jgi:hypothetical protein
MYDLPDGQPKLPVTQHDVLGASKLVLTYNAPFIDLRAYDVDFNFKRQQAIFRMSRLFTDIFRYLLGQCIFTPTNTIVRDGNLVARVCSFHWPFEVNALDGAKRPTCLILPYLSAISLKR